MKIIDVKPYVIETPRPHHGGRAWIFVKLTTDNGIEGIGEAYKVPFHPRTIVAMIRDFGDTYFIDQDPFQIERCGDRSITGMVTSEMSPPAPRPHGAGTTLCL